MKILCMVEIYKKKDVVIIYLLFKYVIENF